MPTTPSLLKGILFDVDGSIMVDGGPFEKPILDIFWSLLSSAFPMGPVSGRPLEYLKGLALGCGCHFSFAAAESGAVWATLRSSSPLVWDVTLTCPSLLGDLAAFEELSRLNRRRQSFELGGTIVHFFEQPKQGEISIFPRGDLSLHYWIPAFQQLIEANQLELKVVGFPDGSVTISPKGSSKKCSVEMACQYLQCDPTDLLTVVDGINDTELAQDTTCIAVANANDKLKKLVTSKGELGYIAACHHGYGFIEGLQHFANMGRLPETISDIVKTFTFPEVSSHP